jgi:23S rRNA (cytidine1920-2'-O)/16S rRNA (cytidine1409-2'-O)-methyltransferase
VRADLALVAQGLAPSRERARALILAGEVLEGDRPVAKAGELVGTGGGLRLRSEPMPYVSRGGLKLAHALATFALDVRGRVALDVGASTGGFTDCLLQAGAARVVAVDVGHGQLDWKIASDPRVTVLDRTNIRYLRLATEAMEGTTPPSRPGAVLPRARLLSRCDLATVDVSFISLRLVLPALLPLLAAGSPVVALVKPQFEVGRGKVGKGGIVRDESARATALATVADAARALGFAVCGDTRSPITGGKGNVEFLLYLRVP